MKPVAVICPSCNCQTETDQDEEVNLCKLCGKPFATKDAINLYTKSVERNANSRTPSQEVIEKFNAILAQDCNLAKLYLDDILKKDYPKLLWSFSNGILCFHNEEQYKNLYSLNPCIADMYYKVACAQANALYKEKYNLTFYGALPFLKVNLANLKDGLHSIAYFIEREEYLTKTENYWSKTSNFVKNSEELRNCRPKVREYWNRILECAEKYYHYQGKEYDDEFILYLIDIVERFAADCSISVNNFINSCRSIGIKSLKALVTYFFEEFLSSGGKKALIPQREKRKKEIHEAKMAKELTFWNKYISLLKSGNVKDAMIYLESGNSINEVCKEELAKFKKGIFGVKYTGNEYELEAEALAERTLKNFE